MSQETSGIFTLLRKKCEAVSECENEPFTISSRNFIESNYNGLCSSIGDDINGARGFVNDDDGDARKKSQGLTLKDGEELPEFLKDKFNYGDLVGKPLEEVDPNFISENTFLVICRDGRVRRLSAKKSSFIFNPFSRLRRIGILILANWQLPVLIGISLCFICLSFVLPNYASNAVSTAIWNLARIIFGGLLFIEICVNVLARGILVAEFTFLRSPWDWFDLGVFLLIFVNYYWRSLPLLRSILEGIVLLKFIPVVPALKTGFHATNQIFKNLVPVFVFSFFTLWILVVVGFHIKNTHGLNSFNNNNDIMPNNCEIHRNQNSNDSSTQIINLPTTPGLLYYNNYNNSSNNLILNSTLQNECSWRRNFEASPIRNLTIQTANRIFFNAFGKISNKFDNFLYVSLTLVFGTFGVSILTVASVGLTFFALRLSPHNNSYTTFTSPAHGNKKRNKFLCLPQFQLPKCDTGALNKISNFVFHPFFELFITTVVCVDIAFIFWSVVIKTPEALKLRWIVNYDQEVCMIIYAIEFIFKLCSNPSKYVKNWWHLLDLAVLIIYAMDKFHHIPNLLQMRVLKILPRWPTLQLILLIAVKSIWSRLFISCVLILELISVRIAATIYLNGLGNEMQMLSTFALAQSFLFHDDWIKLFDAWKDALLLGIFTWISELIIGIVLISVIFVAVINHCCDLISRPVNPCCENYNYKNLCKAISLIRKNLLKCCSRKNVERRSEGSSPHSLRLQIPTLILPIPSPTSNGGPKHGITRNGNKQSIVHNNHSTLQERKFSQVSSVFEVFRKIQYFEMFSFGIIFTASLALVLQYESMQIQVPIHYNPRLYIDFIFVCYFLLILLWKLIKDNFKPLKSPGWLLDFLIVSASGFSMYAAIFCTKSVREIPAVKLIIILSCLKGMMLIHKIEWLKVAVVGIISQIRILWRYLVGLLVVFICLLLWLKNNQSKLVIDDDEKPSPSLLAQTLIKILVRNGALLTQVLICGIYVGVTISELLRNELLAFFMTPAQCITYKDKELSIKRGKTLHIPAPKSGLFSQITHYMTLTHAFDLTVMATILCDCLVITFNHLATSEDWRIIWGYYPPFIICTYACELLMKFVGWRKYFLKSAWNIFDLFTVIVGIIDLVFVKVQIGFITADTIRFLRVLRIFQLKLFTNNAKLFPLFYYALLRVLPSIGNLILLQSLLLYTYTTIGLSYGVSIENQTFVVSSSSVIDEISKAFSQFNAILLSLIKLPFYGDIRNFHIAQTYPCWTKYLGILLSIYVYSFTILNYLVVGSIFAIVLYEILKAVGSSRKNVFTKQESTIYYGNDADQENGRYGYKHHMNGGFLNCDFSKTPDDQDLSTATMLTPIEPLAEDVLGEEEKCDPVKLSANGYILHVEALVTTV